MADIVPTRILQRWNNVLAYEWVLSEGDVALAVEVPFRADKTVQASGTFGSSTIDVQGSLAEDQSAFATLHDPQGNDIALTAAGIETVLENVAFIRPSITGGSGATVTVRILMR